MRAIAIVATFAALSLGVTGALTDLALAQGLVSMSPTADSAAPVGKPKYDDIKFQTGTALPPKTGALVVLGGPWLAPPHRAPKGAAGRSR